jgi:uncharacterized SAM-binding protein YcdF (DUF218 family)
MIDDSKPGRQQLSRVGIRRWLTGGLLVLLLWVLVAWLGARWLIVSAPLEQADVIVMLSGSKAYPERARCAAELFKQKVAPVIVLTNDGQQGGWSNAEERNPYFYEQATEELVRLGVPQSAIEVLPQNVSSTYDEAVAVNEYARQRELHSVLVVTSGYHARRALWSFHRVFTGSGKKIGIQNAPPGPQTPRPLTWWFYPNGWRAVASEYVKMAYYRIKIP